MTAAETPPAPPAPPAAPPPISVRAILGEAWHVMMTYPRAAFLPLIAIQVPVAIISSAVSIGLYLTVFKDEPFQSLSDLFDGGASGPLFALLVLAAFEGLFGQVARAATVVSVAAARKGQPRPLTECLDPAFTRMGGLLLLGIGLGAAAIGAAVSVVGIILLPYVGMRVALSFEAYMLDGLGPWAAVKRSWSVMRGNVLRLLGALLLFLCAVIGPLVVISLIGNAAVGGRDAQVVSNGLFTIVQTILLIPLLAFLTSITTVFYLTARARHDDSSFA